MSTSEVSLHTSAHLSRALANAIIETIEMRVWKVAQPALKIVCFICISPLFVATGVIDGILAVASESTQKAAYAALGIRIVSRSERELPTIPEIREEDSSDEGESQVGIEEGDLTPRNRSVSEEVVNDTSTIRADVPSVRERSLSENIEDRIPQSDVEAVRATVPTESVGVVASPKAEQTSLFERIFGNLGSVVKFKFNV